MCYIVAEVTAWSHFPNNKGLVSGLTLSGFGFGGFLFNILSVKLTNPDNLDTIKGDDGEDYFPREVFERLPNTLRVCVMIWAGLAIIAIGTINKKAPKKEE